MAEFWDAFDEGLGVGVLGVCQHIPRGARLNDFASVHDSDAVGDAADDCEVMGDEDHRHVKLLFQQTKLVEDLFLNSDVEGGGWFVGH